jgi:hypothetical protein
VFVSLTFSDQVAERNALQELDFPGQRELRHKHSGGFKRLICAGA